MKVLFVDQIAKVNYKYSFSLANALEAVGANVALVMDQKEEDAGCGCEKYRWFNTDEKNIKKSRKFLNYISSYKKIKREIEQGEYQVLHIQWLIFSPVDYYYLHKIKKKTGIKIVVTIHDILPFNQKFYDYRCHKKIYDLADEIIVQADNNIERFDELFPRMAGKEVMIPHGHFLDYAERIDKNTARNHLDFLHDEKIVLFFGQIKKVKGVGVLLNAFAQIKDENPNVLLVIAGSVWKDDFSQYQEIIDQKGMGKAVRTDIRYIPDEEIKYYYSAADFCVLPYLDVYQSGVVQLSYAYKKPVVATRLGAFKEVVLEGRSGFMCEPGDVDSLREALQKALDSYGRYDEMGQAGYDYIREKFSWTEIAKKIVELYQKVV